MRALAIVLSVCVSLPVLAAPDLPQARQDELRHLLIQDCGSCHGLRMKGGLGPPLTPQALSEKPAEALELIILNGIPDTAMPPWRGMLSEDEVAYIVQLMLRGIEHE